MESAYDGKWFHGQGQWAHLTQTNCDEMIDYMRHCYKNRPNNPEGVETGKSFTWDKSAKIIIQDLQPWCDAHM